MFISIDGPDGVGKTTVAKAVVKQLNENNQRAVFTTEPTNSKTGHSIRTILAGDENISSRDLLNLFIKDRAEHIEEFVKPNLLQNVAVVTDRYKYSTVCYQHLQGFELEELIALNREFIAPDISFILYVDDIDILLQRINNRNEKVEIFETREFLEKCNTLYKSMPAYFERENFVFVNAGGSPQDILQSVMDVIG